MGEYEDEVVVEIGELVVVLELLPNPGLIGIGGDVLLQKAADLAEPLLSRLPQRRRLCCHRPAATNRFKPSEANLIESNEGWTRIKKLELLPRREEEVEERKEKD